MQCGLLGGRLGHSYSPKIHSLLADYAYDLYEKQPEALADFLKNGGFSGLNVTIPYKKAVIPFCAELSPRAETLGAVNTLVRRKDGSLIGHNTDYSGFSYMVEKSGLSVAGKKCLVLGSGGASATACAVLEALGARVVVISRSGPDNYGNLSRHRDAAVIVNTTPVGMYPNTGESPVALSQFPGLEGVLDVIYNPARTRLLLDAEVLGIPAMNGLWMLVAQAKESAEWFTGREIPDDEIPRIHGMLRREMENIVLIGMPGSGKSTVGAALAAETGKRFVDADDEIIRAAGMTIPEIFARQGEPGFRELETQVLARLGRESGLVIATGGGCVTRPENAPLLRQNGSVFWLRRALEKLPTEGRPLSQAGSLREMEAVRTPLYEAFSDHPIDNNAAVSETVRRILEVWK